MNIHKKDLLIAIITLFSVTSCSDVLNTEPYDRIGEDVVWSNKANAETFIYSTYGIMNSYASGPRSDGYTQNLLSTDGTYNNYSPVFTETIDRYSDVGGFSNFSSIRRCNQIIAKVAESPSISDADKQALIAEGKFLRAMSYYNVARRVGRICWIDKVLAPEDVLTLPSTANPTESYNYIIKDLEDAVAGLPTDKVSGRANKYVAAAFLSQVCLQAAAYKNYPNPPALSANDPLIEKAINYGNMVVNDGGYSLETNYGDMFNEANPKSAEIIFAIYRKALNTTCDGTPMQNMVPNFNNDRIKSYGGSPLLKSSIQIFEAWLEHVPTYNLTKDYLTIDANDPNLAVEWDKTSQYLNAVIETTTPTHGLKKQDNESFVKVGTINPNSAESVWSLTNQKRDARWAQTFVTDSTNYMGELITTHLGGNANRWMKIGGFTYYTSISNMYWRKGIYTNVNPRVYVGVQTDYHYVVMRLGKVYLNLAEAYLLKGNIAKAVEMLNKTRVVHGKLPASTANTLAEAWKDYKRERRVDLVLEDDYYYSLLRWGRYGGDANSNIASGGNIPELTEKPFVMDISNDRKAFSVIQGTFWSSSNIRNFTPNKRYLFPIQQGLIEQNSEFGPQNPGW